VGDRAPQSSHTPPGAPVHPGPGPGRVGHDHGVHDRPRLLPLTGAYNFRDLGGYAGRDGRTTRWNTLFRSDTLHELTGPDVDRLVSMGLATIIDLRTERELERSGRGPLAGHAIGFHHLSVIGEGGGDRAPAGGSGASEAGEAVAAPAPAGEELSARYLWYLETGRSALVEALTLLGRPDRYPAVFHCAAGKDRTGVLAALVLGIVGVAPEVIVADYELTAARMPMIMDRYRTDPAFVERLASVPASRFSVEAATMERFLTGLDDRYGGARAWALGAGVAEDSLEGLTETLLDGPTVNPGPPPPTLDT